jgi:hypothetical protein
MKRIFSSFFVWVWIGIGFVITTVDARGQNEAPVVEACSDRQISLPDDTRVYGTVTDDGLPSDTLLYQWTQVSGPGIAAFSNATQRYTDVGFSTNGVYVLRITVSDTELEAYDEVTVTVASYGNERPYVNVDYMGSATVLPESAMLEASVSDDGLPDGTVTTAWTKVSGPGPVVFDDTQAIDTIAHFSVDGLYTLRLTASDGELVDSDTVSVYVEPGYEAYRCPVTNADLSGTGEAPAHWTGWGTDQHQPETGTFLSPSNSWRFSGEGGLRQEIAVSNLDAGFFIGLGGALFVPSSDPLRDGTRSGVVKLEFLQDTTVIHSVTAPVVDQNSTQDAWLLCEEQTTMPSNATAVRLSVSCENAASGSGAFLADDLYLGYGASCIDDVDITNNSSLAVVAGHPAAAYVVEGQLKYAFSDEADGRGRWTVMTVDTNDYCRSPRLAVVAGCPVIAYHKFLNGDLKFAACPVSNGIGSWTNLIVDEEDTAGCNLVISEVDGRPAILAISRWQTSGPKYTTYHYDLYFYINSASNGLGTWASQMITNGYVNSYGGVHRKISDCDMALVGGRPAVTFDIGTQGIFYAINENADGSGEWISQHVTDEYTYPHTLSLANISGKPMICGSRYYASYPHGLYTALSSTTNGFGSWSVSDVGAEDNVRWHSLAEMAGKPAIAFARGGSGRNTGLFYTRNTDTNGTGDWLRYDLYRDVKAKENCTLCEVHGGPAVLFAASEGTPVYIGSPGDGRWTDTDGDGMTDYNEGQAGTDPYSDVSKLFVSGVTLDNGNAVVQWQGGTNVAQYLLYRTNLFSGEWVCLYSNLPPMNTTNQRQLPNNDASGYYRIQVGP